jgi:hypothetical protein
MHEDVQVGFVEVRALDVRGVREFHRNVAQTEVQNLGNNMDNSIHYFQCSNLGTKK